MTFEQDPGQISGEDMAEFRSDLVRRQGELDDEALSQFRSGPDIDAIEEHDRVRQALDIDFPGSELSD